MGNNDLREAQERKYHAELKKRLPTEAIKKINSEGISYYNACRGLNEAIATSPRGNYNGASVSVDSIISNAKSIVAQEKKNGSGNYLKNSPYNNY